MSRERRELATLRFVGPRFDDHSLDVDVLPELMAYKKLLLETAKDVWRLRNPGRARLPRGFEAGIAIKFYGLVPGSTAVRLEREVEVQSAATLPFDEPVDEIDEAVLILGDSIESADHVGSLPDNLPRDVLPLFDTFGQTLREDECIWVSSPQRPNAVRYDAKVREKILSWVEPVYHDRVEFTGEVRSTDLDGEMFTIRLDDGRKVRGPFRPDQEAAILEALSSHSSRRLRIHGKAEFSRADSTLRRLINVNAVAFVDRDEDGIGADQPDSLLSVVAGITAQVPDEAWQTVPSDLAQNLDFYLYGRRAGDR